MQFVQESGNDGCWHITKGYVFNQEPIWIESQVYTSILSYEMRQDVLTYEMRQDVYSHMKWGRTYSHMKWGSMYSHMKWSRTYLHMKWSRTYSHMKWGRSTSADDRNCTLYLEGCRQVGLLSPHQTAWVWASVNQGIVSIRKGNPIGYCQQMTYWVAACLRHNARAGFLISVSLSLFFSLSLILSGSI